MEGGEGARKPAPGPPSMRLLIDTLIALMLAGILAAVLWQYRKDAHQVRQVQGVHQSLARLQEQMLYRGALGDTPTGAAGFPLEVSPLWFPDGLPFNNLVPGRQPWVDVAPEGDQSNNPPDPVLRQPSQAGFWYNPNRGVFRARVPARFTQGATLELYNDVNGTFLSTLEERIVPRVKPPQRPSLASKAAEEESFVADSAPTPAAAPAAPPTPEALPAPLPAATPDQAPAAPARPRTLRDQDR